MTNKENSQKPEAGWKWVFHENGDKWFMVSPQAIKAEAKIWEEVNQVVKKCLVICLNSLHVFLS